MNIWDYFLYHILPIMIGVTGGTFVATEIMWWRSKRKVKKMIKDALKELKNDGDTMQRLEELGKAIARGAITEFKKMWLSSNPKPPSLELLLSQQTRSRSQKPQRASQ